MCNQEKEKKKEKNKNDKLIVTEMIRFRSVLKHFDPFLVYIIGDT